jgi:hypothetical protein
MTPARRHYSIIRHLAWSIWFNHDPKKCFVMVTSGQFVAAYDASGSDGDKTGTLVVTGLVANEYKWNRFEDEWRAVLRKFDVPYLHMKELGDRHRGSGVYAKWKDDEATPRVFLRALCKVLRRRLHKTFCYGTVLDDYWEVNKQFRLCERVGRPYVFTAASCYDQVNAWMRRKYPKAPILHVFEDGDVGQRDLKRLAKKHNQIIIPLPKINPTNGEWHPPFQGADLVAGAYRRASNMRGMVTAFEDYGEVFNELAEMLPQKSLIHHKDVMLKNCLANPAEFPPRA